MLSLGTCLGGGMLSERVWCLGVHCHYGDETLGFRVRFRYMYTAVLKGLRVLLVVRYVDL